MLPGEDERINIHNEYYDYIGMIQIEVDRTAKGDRKSKPNKQSKLSEYSIKRNKRPEASKGLGYGSHYAFSQLVLCWFLSAGRYDRIKYLC